jgi:DNA-binding MarR family transcriptional regulator
MVLRILTALVEEPATATDLVTKLGTAQASTSRRLTQMLREGLVTKERTDIDRRRRLYTVTREGRALLGRHRALVAPPPGPPKEVTPERRGRYLRGALDGALTLRRQTNRLDVAAERLRVVVDRADVIEDQALAIDATAELVTTLRQSGDHDALHPLLERLERISVGQEQSSGRTALPAFAHHAYALGRLKVRNDAELIDAQDHLRTAIIAYGQLAEVPPYGARRDWESRQAWSVIGLGDNLRRRSQYERAFGRTHEALKMFRAIDDPYGTTRSLIHAGFCLRLMGSYPLAGRCLEAALRLADEHQFERFRADALMHMGEVHRCLGHLNEAQEALAEAISHAEQMQLTTLQAFAQSALGAVACQRADLGEAKAVLARAQQMFEQIEHPEGLALNQRRNAVVARHMLVEGVGDARVVGVLLGAVYRKYARLRSPAGMAACDVEKGRLALLTQKKFDNVVIRLTGELDRTDSRGLIERDPWMPEVLADFASAAQDPRLTERTDIVLANAEALRGDKRQELVTAVDQVAKPVDPSCDEDDQKPKGTEIPAADMGGETRRDLTPALQAA